MVEGLPFKITSCDEPKSYVSKDQDGDVIYINRNWMRMLPSGGENFLMIPALNGEVNAVSFQNQSDTNLFLRHKGFKILLEKFADENGFKDDVSFYPRHSTYCETGVMYECCNIPNYYVTIGRFGLIIANFENTTEEVVTFQLELQKNE
uniref:Uncharacterized LOC100180264 n=1 Tax=Ciona intestinalis TaxID=7719 RepID=F7BJE8_CIOIN|nr:uncharacterized protein LOC100180264 [Ciona intestinalis]|eukprot:XP_002127281.1 uncharacterized protein LOC100180264 [Ciona intestinalis]